MGIIAAGNCAVIRVAHYTPNAASTIAALVSEFLDPKAFAVFQGGRDVTTACLQQRYDSIFFTGGPDLGRIIHQAAQKHLTPCVFELGGKSPCIVDSTADIAVAAKRFTWGTFTNAGQTCVRPDYLLIHEKVADKFLAGIDVM